MTHRQFWLETWAAADEFARTNPREAEQLLRTWIREDECFRTLHLFCWACKTSKPEFRNRAQQVIDRHWHACRRCRPNVLTAAETAQEPYKRSAYREAVLQFDKTHGAVNGGNGTIEERPEGMYFRWSLAEGAGLPDRPFSAIERFCPRDPRDGGYYLFEVKGQECFENPRPLLQHLDATAADEVQIFPPATAFRHWRPIRGAQAEKLLIRWNGKVKEIASDWGLGTRYKEFLERDMPAEAYIEEPPPHTKQIRNLGEQALVLEETAISYTEEKRQEASFSGFLWSKLRYDRKTAGKMRSKDPLACARPGEVDPQDDDNDDSPAPEPFETFAKRAWDADESRRQQAIDLTTQIKRIWPRLSLRQRQVLRLHLQQLTDDAIAKRLKCRRETVVRDRSKILNLLKDPRVA